MSTIKKTKKILFFTAFYAGVAIIVGTFVFPFAWMVFSSFKPGVELMEIPPKWFSLPTLINYKNVFVETAFVSRAFNSFIVATLSVGFGMVLGLPAAYAIARYRHRILGITILMTRMIPGISFLVPWFIIYRHLNLLDSYRGMAAAHLVLTLPLIIWITIGFFEDLPREMEEAARIDGCNKWQAFIKIVLPLCRPGIATAAILSFIFCWNHFLFALVLAGPNTNTLPVTVFQFISYEEIDFGGMYAAATLITAPIVILVMLIQNQFVEGLTMGGLKG